MKSPTSVVVVILSVVRGIEQNRHSMTQPPNDPMIRIKEEEGVVFYNGKGELLGGKESIFKRHPWKEQVSGQGGMGFYVCMGYT